jgi:hypothetical protein
MGDALPTVTSLDELCRVVEGRQLYVRVSRGPLHDRARTSTDYESGLDLPGLSVNPLTPESWWTRPLEDWLARQVCDYVHLLEDSADERRMWVLAGRIVARGPDNEPLLADVEPVAELSDACVREAQARYRECFEAGNDST